MAARGSDPAPTVLTVPEAAARLRCSRGHVYNLVAAGELDVIDIAPPGSTKPKTRVLDESVDAFLRRRIRNARSLRASA